MTRYTALILASLRARLAYRGAFGLALLGAALSLAAQWFLWRAIFADQPERPLAGFSLAQIGSYLLLAQGVAPFVDNRLEHDIAADVLRGDIVVALVRPQHYTLQRACSALGTALAHALGVALPLLALSLFWLPLPWPGTGQAGLFALSLGLATGVALALNTLLGAAALLTTNIWGLQTLKTALLGIFSGQLIPLSFFSPGWQQVLDWLPFKALVHTPCVIGLGQAQAAAAWRLLAQQALWLGLLALLCAWVWRRAAGRLEVAGG